jgi:hypothetical protein
LVGIERLVTGRNMTVVGTRAMEYRWLLPSALSGEPDVGGPVRRSTRDWIVDATAFLIGLASTFLLTLDLLSGRPEVVPGFAGSPAWMVWLDLVVAVALAAGLWWRRRWPVELAYAAAVLCLFTLAGSLTVLMLLFTVVVHRRFAVAIVPVALTVATSSVFYVIRPEGDTSFGESVAQTGVGIVIVLLWGMVVRARRQLVVSPSSSCGSRRPGCWSATGSPERCTMCWRTGSRWSACTPAPWR